MDTDGPQRFIISSSDLRLIRKNLLRGLVAQGRLGEVLYHHNPANDDDVISDVTKLLGVYLRGSRAYL